MYYIIYKITNTMNGKIYIGCHKTENIKDDYMGSGTLLKRAINKYGIDCFEKKILHIFDNPEDMFDMESNIVNEGFIKNIDNYNIKLGGNGGFDYINDNNINHKNHDINKMSKLGNDKKKWLLNNDPDWRKKFCENRSKMSKQAWKKGKYDGLPNGFKGKTHTEETKRKIGEANSINLKGKKNWMYGKCWIYNVELRQSKPVDKKELDKWISKGWVKGAVHDWNKYDMKNS